MKLFGQLVRTVVNVAALPVEVVRDVVTLGGAINGENDDEGLEGTYTARRLQQLKDEAKEDVDD